MNGRRPFFARSRSPSCVVDVVEEGEDFDGLETREGAVSAAAGAGGLLSLPAWPLFSHLLPPLPPSPSLPLPPSPSLSPTRRPLTRRHEHDVDLHRLGRAALRRRDLEHDAVALAARGVDLRAELERHALLLQRALELAADLAVLIGGVLPFGLDLVVWWFGFGGLDLVVVSGACLLLVVFGRLLIVAAAAGGGGGR